MEPIFANIALDHKLVSLVWFTTQTIKSVIIHRQNSQSRQKQHQSRSHVHLSKINCTMIILYFSATAFPITAKLKTILVKLQLEKKTHQESALMPQSTCHLSRECCESWRLRFSINTWKVISIKSSIKCVLIRPECSYICTFNIK